MGVTYDPWKEREAAMEGKEKNKRLFSSYISKEVYDIMEFLIQREETSKVVFVRRAIRCFMETDRSIEPRLRITKRNNPDYVERGALVTVYMEDGQREQLKAAAKEQGCTLSQAFFQAVLNYCAVLVSLDQSGMEIKEEQDAEI